MADLTPVLKHEPADLLALLGDYWTAVFDDQAGLGTLMAARQELVLQNRQDVDDLSAAIGLTTIPLYRRFRWLPLLLDPAAVQLNNQAYSSDALLGPDGARPLSGRTWDYPLPANIKSIPYLSSGLSQPVCLLTQGIDYQLDITAGTVRFVRDPFQHPELIPSLDNGTLTLFGFQATQDDHRLYTAHGYYLGFDLPLLPTAKPFLQAVRQAGLQGPTRATLEQALAALTDGPLSLNHSETVIDLVTEPDRQLILTDQNCYACSLNATIQVAIGQTISAGTPLTDAFTVYYLTRNAPSAALLPSLVVPAAMLLGTIDADLILDNALTPLQVSTVNGRTKVTWAITTSDGSPATAAAFWTAVHTRGTAADSKSLAQMLDLRPQPQTTDPDRYSLPAQINPVDFLCQNLLGHNAVVVTTRAAAFGGNALGLSYLNQALHVLISSQQYIFLRNV